MKTISKDGAIRRLSDLKAEKLVNNGGWKYVPKSEWKKTRATKQVKQTKKSDKNGDNASKAGKNSGKGD